MTSQVIYCLTTNGDGQDKAQGTPVGVQVANTNVRQELAQRHDEEIEVQEETELLEEDHRQEGEKVVLLVPDLVGRELVHARLADANGPWSELLRGPPFSPQPPPAAGKGRID